MKFEILCESETPPALAQDGSIQCGGELIAIPYSPVLGDLTFQQVGELAGAAMLLFLMAFLFRFIFDNIRNR